MRKKLSKRITRTAKLARAVKRGGPTKRVEPAHPANEKPEGGLCHFCKAKCNPDDYCYGCGKYICETMKCNPRAVDVPWGGHDVNEHQEHQEDVYG